MAEYVFSLKTRKTASEYELTPHQLAFVDLIHAGWDRKDAYVLTMQLKASHSASAIDREARELLARLPVKRRLKELKVGVTDVNDEKVVSDDISEAISKEQTLRDLYVARKQYKAGSKEWIELTKMIADITKMKNDEIIKEDNTVHFYLPMTCSRCRLYADHKEAEKKKEKQ